MVLVGPHLFGALPLTPSAVLPLSIFMGSHTPHLLPSRWLTHSFIQSFFQEILCSRHFSCHIGIVQRSFSSCQTYQRTTHQGERLRRSEGVTSPGSTRPVHYVQRTLWRLAFRTDSVRNYVAVCHSQTSISLVKIIIKKIHLKVLEIALREY